MKNASLPSPSEAGLHDSGGDASRFIPSEESKRVLADLRPVDVWFIPTKVRKRDAGANGIANLWSIPTEAGKLPISENGLKS